MIQNFLYNLSYRKSNENDLSDITWAMCETSEKFKELFLKFFFPNVDFSNLITFDREWSKGNSRVDFYIEVLDRTRSLKIYLVEVKKSDEGHHFDYIREYKTEGSNFGYIANYSITNSYIEQKCKEYNIEYIDEVKNIKFKTWEQFYDYIKENLPQDNTEKEFWEGYLSYLKSVCSIVKINKKMDLKGMYSLYLLTEALKKNIEREEENFKLKFNKTTTKTNYVGHYFKIEYLSSKIENTIAWIGVYYDRESPVICLGFDSSEGWGLPVHNILNNELHNINERGLVQKPYKEGNSIYFDMKNTGFQNAETPEEQMNILKNFIDEVVTIPLKL